MTSPVSRLPLTTAHIAVLQSRPAAKLATPKPAVAPLQAAAPAAGAQTAALAPHLGAQKTSGVARVPPRGALLNIIA
ncbi:MAG: hypothetical protein IRZ04_14305 [Rhodospirillales bacterium]|nr:hypothetical protein [Rhodospirillales bacterium]